MKKKVLILVITGIVLSGCDGNRGPRYSASDYLSEEPEAGQQELATVRVAVQEYYISSPIGYILENRLDEKFGLKVEPVLYPSGAEQMTDVDKDVYDVATIGAAFLYPLMEDKAVLIGEHIRVRGGNDIYTRQGNEVLTTRGFNPMYQNVYGDPESVKGKTILMKENTTIQYLGMKWLESIGVRAEEVQIEYQDFAQLYEEFRGGFGDVVVLPAPFSYQAKQDGFPLVAGTESLHCDMYEVIIATNQAYETEPETLIRFLELLLYADGELEADFKKKVELCESWYADHGVDYTADIVRQECKDKIFITRDNYSMEEFGKFENKYAEYMAAIGNMPPEKLKSVRNNMDGTLFEQALKK